MAHVGQVLKSHVVRSASARLLIRVESITVCIVLETWLNGSSVLAMGGPAEVAQPPGQSLAEGSVHSQ